MPEREQITIYSAKVCPFAHRVEIALKESGLPYERYEINLREKPEWYVAKVNAEGKVPAIAFGGPMVPPDQPSPGSVKLTESVILSEFVNDLCDTLLPKDPVLRAKGRFFIETISSKLVPAWTAAINDGASTDDILKAIEAIQELLPPEGYAVGEWSLADAALVPLLARNEINLKNDWGAFEEGTGTKAWEKLSTDPKFERIREYYNTAKLRKSFQETFDEEHVVERYKTRFPALRAKRLEGKV